MSMSTRKGNSIMCLKKRRICLPSPSAGQTQFNLLFPHTTYLTSTEGCLNTEEKGQATSTWKLHLFQTYIQVCGFFSYTTEKVTSAWVPNANAQTTPFPKPVPCLRSIRFLWSLNLKLPQTWQATPLVSLSSLLIELQGKLLSDLTLSCCNNESEWWS